MPYGSMVEESLNAAKILKEHGLEVSVVNLRFAKPLSQNALEPILSSHDLIITVEEHALAGGVGSALLELVCDASLKTGCIVRLGIPDRFIPFASRNDQLAEAGLNAESIADTVLSHTLTPVSI